MNAVVTIITCLVTVVVFRTVHTFVAADMLASRGFLHLPRTAFHRALRLNLLRSERNLK